MEQTGIKYYDKILVAKYNPRNKCFVEDGGILIVYPKILKGNKGTFAHDFTYYSDKKTKSRYGWVTATAPVTLDMFTDKYFGEIKDPTQTEHIRIMLDSIQHLKVDTPVAATYSERGIETKRIDFTVHKVFFYK